MKIVLLILSLASLASAGWTKDISHDVGINVFNGTDAYPGQFPYMAAVQSNGVFICGGVLINANWVIADSFCIGSLEVQVVLGLHDTEDFENGGQPEVYDVEQAVREPSGDNFILLLKLSRSVAPGNPYIQTIALAPQDDYDYVGANCYYCGWGYTESGNYAGMLKYAQANVVNGADCPSQSAIELCIKDGYTGTCLGDYGGPLVCRRDSQTYLVGTLKFSSWCGTTGRSRFHRISFYSDWIRAVIG